MRWLWLVVVVVCGACAKPVARAGDFAEFRWAIVETRHERVDCSHRECISSGKSWEWRREALVRFDVTAADDEATTTLVTVQPVGLEAPAVHDLLRRFRVKVNQRGTPPVDPNPFQPTDVKATVTVAGEELSGTHNGTRTVVRGRAPAANDVVRAVPSSRRSFELVRTGHLETPVANEGPLLFDEGATAFDEVNGHRTPRRWTTAGGRVTTTTDLGQVKQQPSTLPAELVFSLLDASARAEEQPSEPLSWNGVAGAAWTWPLISPNTMVRVAPDAGLPPGLPMVAALTSYLVVLTPDGGVAQQLRW